MFASRLFGAGEMLNLDYGPGLKDKPRPGNSINTTIRYHPRHFQHTCEHLTDGFHIRNIQTQWR